MSGEQENIDFETGGEPYERGEMAAALTSLIENLPVGMLIFAPDGRVLLCNALAGEYLGLSAKEIVGNKTADIPLHFYRENGDPLPAAEYPFRQVLALGKRIDNFVMGVNLDDKDRQRWVVAHTYPEFDARGRMVRVFMVIVNIARRKQAEGKLKEEQFFTYSLMNNLPDAIYFKDRESRFIRTNKAHADFLHLDDPTQAIGKTDFDFFSEDHAQLAYQDEQEIIRSGQPLVAKEEKLTTPDGRITWVSSTKMPLIDPNGKISGTFGVSYDITRRKNMEERLADSEKRFRTLFEQAAVGVGIVDCMTEKFISLNRRYCEMLGYSEEELKKLKFSEVTKTDDLEISLDHFKSLLRGDIREYTIEKRYVCKDGSFVFAAVNVSAMWAPGEEPTTMIAIAQDISARKRAEEAERKTRDFLQNLVDNATAPIITWDSDSRITLFNRAFEKLTGFNSGEVLGKPLEILFPQDTRAISLERVAGTLQGRQLELDELPILHKNGGIRLVVWNTSNLYSDDGDTLIATIAHGQDITDRHQMEQYLLQHTFELEKGQEFAAALRSAQTVNELLEIYVEKISGFLDIPASVTYLDEGQPDLLDQAAGGGWLFDLSSIQIPREGGVAEIVYSSQKPFKFENCGSDLIKNASGANLDMDFGGVCIPLLSDGEMVGVTFLASPLPVGFHEQEISLMMVLAETITNAIKRTRLRTKLQQSFDELKQVDARRQKMQDLLAREKEFLSVTFMSIGDGLIRVNKDGIISLFNQSAEEITEYKAMEALGRPYEQVFKLLDYNTNEPMTNTIENLLILEKIEKTSTDYRVQTLITRTGKRILVSGSISLLKAAGEDAPGYVLAFRDVSEKYNKETQTALSQKMEAIGQLAAGIAHEINTPIQYIGDNINFLQRAFTRFGETMTSFHNCLTEHSGETVTPEKLDEMEMLYQEKKIAHYLSEVPIAIQESQEGIDRVRKIVVAIREFSHASDQEMKMADLNRAILTTVTISRSEWKYFAEMETDLDPDLPQVYCQVDEINQVVLNMIINAAQAIQQIMPKNSEEKGKIKISTFTRKNNVLITVADTGSGIPESIRDRIFDPFFTTKEIGKGTGQGLALAHNIIVKKHGGRIDVQSEPGKGTTFTIELKVENPEEGEL